jgi:hypothetical protein
MAKPPVAPAVPPPKAAAVPTPAPAKPPAPKPPAPARLDGGEGLPAFPDIEQPVPASAPTAEPLTMAQRVKQANEQAAVLMTQGRAALLSGQLFAAIEAFNGVLKLPSNKYSADAQIWIGIARERSGQISRAKAEYELYLKLYKDGKDARWVRERLGRLQRSHPEPPVAKPVVPAAVPAHTAFQTTTYGSLSVYYYHGASQTDTVATIAGVQTPTTLSLTDQSSLIGNTSVTVRSNNDRFDNRFVLQDFYSASFLTGQQNRNRLNSAYYDVKNRVDDYSARIGRQSALGGGVLGRFDGVTAGYGFMPNWRASLITGRMSESTLESRPAFYSAGLDFGLNNPLGGSLYVIDQSLEGISDRQATGGYLRYFRPGMTALATLDYDVQFKQLNIVTLQGTLNHASGVDYNFLFDQRRTPSLSIRNAVSGAVYTQGIPNIDPGSGLPIPDSYTYVSAPSTLADLLLNGFTQEDLVGLAKKRTALSNLAVFGVTGRVQERWQLGADIVLSNTTAMPESGTDLGNGITGREGYLPATAASGNSWSLNGRVSGSDVITARDTSMVSLSYTTSPSVKGLALQLFNRAYLREQWTLDSNLRLYRQSDDSGGKVNTVAPQLKAGYLLRNDFTLEAEVGMDWTDSTPAAAPSSKTTRQYFSLGCRWDF